MFRLHINGNTVAQNTETDPTKTSLFSPPWLNSPSGPRPPHCRDFLITDTPHMVGLLWTSDRPFAETPT